VKGEKQKAISRQHTAISEKNQVEVKTEEKQDFLNQALTCFLLTADR